MPDKIRIALNLVFKERPGGQFEFFYHGMDKNKLIPNEAVNAWLMNTGFGTKHPSEPGMQWRKETNAPGCYIMYKTDIAFKDTVEAGLFKLHFGIESLC